MLKFVTQLLPPEMQGRQLYGFTPEEFSKIANKA
jgi:hypothetical protein